MSADFVRKRQAGLADWLQKLLRVLPEDDELLLPFLAGTTSRRRRLLASSDAGHVCAAPAAAHPLQPVQPALKWHLVWEAPLEENAL